MLDSHQDLVTVKLRQALVGEGDQSYREGQYSQALAAYNLADAVASAIDDPAGQALTLNAIGNVHTLLGDYRQALQDYQQSLQRSEALGDKVSVARTLGNIGNIYQRQGNYTQGLEDYRQSLKLSQALNDEAGVATALHNIGNICQEQGNYSQALEDYQQCLTLEKDLGNDEWIDITLNSIGALYDSQGNFARALQYYHASLKLSQTLKDKAGIASALYNTGNTYQEQGDYAQALDYFQKSLSLQEELGDKAGIADSLNNLGNIDALLGNHAEALKSYQQSFALQQGLGDKAGAAAALGSLGRLSHQQGNDAAALEYYQQSLKLSEALSDRAEIAHTLSNIGSIQCAQDRYAEALASGQKGLEIAETIGDPAMAARCSSLIGKIRQAQGRAPEAIAAYQQAVRAIESLRTHVGGGETEQERFFEGQVSPYQALVALLISQHRPAEAFAYAERAKARVLLDVLHRGRINITKAMTAAEQAKERALRDQLVSLSTQFFRESLHPGSDAARASDLNDQLQLARLNYESFLTALYAAHPELKVRRGEAPPLAPHEAAALLPDNKTALLEYVLTDEKGYLFVLTRAVGSQGPVALRVYPLPAAGQELSDAAERFRLELSKPGLVFAPSARRLYELLLKPAEAQLRGKTTLVIVPDGMLWELPFQALQPRPGHFLLEDAALSYAPSLTVLREMERLQRGPEPGVRAAAIASRPSAGHPHPSSLIPRPTSFTLLACGNPVIGPQTQELSSMTPRGERLGALPEAEREVKTLGRLYGPTRSQIYVGAAAREDRVKAEAGHFRVLHFATHGLLNDASPMYSAIVLSPAGSREDGLLEAWELMQLDLLADLTVLSACETARGRVGAGEGVIGLSWALFVAGCPATVVSQWEVADVSTSQLMIAFHRALLTSLRARYSRTRPPGAGLTKAGALREAALKLLKDPRTAHPYYWAPFVLVGDGR